MKGYVMKKMAWFLTVLMALGVTSSNIMAEEIIAKDKVVKFDYTLTVEGSVVDTSEGKEPLQYTHGQNMVIPGLEKQMEGLKVGDERTLVVPAAEAYGVGDPKLIIDVAKANLDPAVTPEKGMVIQMQPKEGQAVPGIVEEVKDTGVVVNFNHPLAGKELTFKIKILEIK